MRHPKNLVRKYSFVYYFSFVSSLEQNAFCSLLDTFESLGQATQGVYKHENWLQCCCTVHTENPVFALEI